MKTEITKVLLVDDDPAMNYVNEFFLKHYKYCENIVIEQYPEDALEKMKHWALESPEEIPQLILLDLNMPVMNGYQLAEAFASSLPQEVLERIKIYILSSSDIDKELKLIRNLSFVKGCLAKPIQIKDLDLIFKGNS